MYQVRVSLMVICAAMWVQLSAQVPGNSCATAIVLPNVNDYCSGNAEYSNVGATPSGLGAPACFAAGNDVWFTFIATAENVTVTIRGNTPTGPGGTLNAPQLAMYSSNDCLSFSELQCATAVQNQATLYKGGLQVGQQYFIRVQGANLNTGTFKLCYTSYFLPDEVSSDCPTGVHFCDKSTVVFPSVVGAGANNDEGTGSCLSEIPPSETNSIWLTWVCDQPGSLTFTLTPTDAGDDLDFAVYRLPNGLGDCGSKQLLRCCASGAFNSSSPPCMGPTGLSLTSNDLTENAGCMPGPEKDNFVKFIDMVANEAYGVLINNFTSTGNGFKIEWGGTGTFKGATPDLQIIGPETGCVGGVYQLTDLSTSIAGPIISRKWNFGVDAVPATANTVGPHNVSYTSPGVKYITLEVETSEGCKVTVVKQYEIVALQTSSMVSNPPTCNGGTDGIFAVSVTGGIAPYTYTWSGGPNQTTPVFNNVSQGVYAVSVQDTYGCNALITVQVNELELVLNPLLTNITPPLCHNTSDGVITAVVLNGSGPYLYNWGQGFQSSSVLGGLPAGSYVLTVTDNNLCQGTFNFVVEPPPPVSVFANSINVTCFGAGDGSVSAAATGGTGSYNYLWSTGFLGATANNLVPGTYAVTATDSHGCTSTTTVSLTEPPQLIVDTLRTSNLICFGDTTGVIELIASGGKKPYRYSIDGNRFQIDSLFTGLVAGVYPAIVRDGNGCKDTIWVELTQPPQLVVYAGPDVTINLGETTDLFANMLNPPFHPVSWQWSPPTTLTIPTEPYTEAKPFETITYQVDVVDSTACRATDALTVFVLKYRPVYIPNSFSPNGDGINDFFTAFANYAAVGIDEMRIFDRWGNKVFEVQDIGLGNELQGWNGTFRGEEAPIGVYSFMLVVSFVDGEKIIYKGDINLLR